MKTRISNLLVTTALIVAGMQAASAQSTWTWVGNTDTNTATDSNWSPAGPLNWDLNAIFGAAGSSGTAINWNAIYNIGSITFNSNASAYTMTKSAGFQFTVTGVNSIANNSTNLQTFTSEVRVFYNGSKGFNANTGNLSLGAVTFRADAMTSGQTNTVTLTGGANGTIGGAISQSGDFTGKSTAITKTGSGTWTLNGNNTGYTGTTTVSQGTLVLGHTNALGTGPVTVNGGTLDLAGRAITLNQFSGSGGTITLGTGGALTANITNGAVTTFSGSITGTGSFVKNGNGGFVLASSNNTYSGDTIISNNWIRNDAVNAFATNGVLRYGSNSTSQLALYLRANQTFAGVDDSAALSNPQPKILDSDGNVSSTLTLDVASGTNYTFSGYVRTIGTGTLSLTKNGAGTQVLSGNSGLVTYSGATTVNAGVLEFSGADSVANNSAITMAGGTVRFSGGGTRSNTIAGSTGTLAKAGANTLTLSGSNTFSGGTLISAGTLQFTNGGSVGGNITNNSALVFSRTDNATAANTISGSGSLTKQGTGTLTLSGNNTYTGTSTLSAGTLTLGHTNALGTGPVTVNGGTLDLAGLAVTLNNLSGSGGTITLGTGGALTANITNGAVTTFSGSITGTGSFVKNGNGGFVLASSNNTYSGDTIISNNWIRNDAVNAFATNGVLRYGSNSTSQLALYLRANQTFAGVDDSAALSNPQPKILDSDGNVSSTLTLDVASGTNYTFSGYVRTIGTGTLSLTKNGAGTQVLSGNSGLVTYSGATTVNAGVLEFSGADSVANNSAITMAGGTVRFSGGGTRSNTIAGSTGTLAKAGANTLTLSGSNSFSGTTDIQGGRLTLSGNGRLGSGAITISNANTGTLELAVTGTNVMANDISGGGALLSSAGETRFTGAVTATGGLTVSGSTVRIGNGGTSGSFSGNTTLSDNTAQMVFDRSNAYAHSGTISGSGSVTKSGAGTTTLTGNNSFSGALAVSAGVLELNASSGAAAASASTVSVATNATLLISKSDQVNNSAAVTLSGGTITRASGVSEVFGSLNLTDSSFLDFGGGTAGTITFSGISYTPSALRALDIANFNQGSMLVFQTTNNLSMTGFTFSGTGGFGSSSFNGSTFTITAIPEPTTVLAAIGLLGLMLWPLRRHMLMRKLLSIASR